MDTPTVLGLLARHLLTTVGGYLAGKGLLGNDAASLQNFIGAGMVILGVGWSGYQKYGRVLIDETLARARGIHPMQFVPPRPTGLSIIVLAILLCAGSNARAADLKAPLLKAPMTMMPAYLTMAGWQGFYTGASITGSGTGVNVANLGSITSMGSALGIEGGWENFNGQTLFGVRAGYAYDVSSPGSVVGASFSDKSLWHAGIVFGGNLTGALGFPQPNANSSMFAQLFANSVPYAAVEGCGHRGMNGVCSSVGIEFIVPNSRLTVFTEYTNGQFGGTSNAPGQTMSTDNSLRVGGLYHW